MIIIVIINFVHYRARRGVFFFIPPNLHQYLKAAVPTVNIIVCIVDEILQNLQQSVTATAPHNQVAQKAHKEKEKEINNQKINNNNNSIIIKFDQKVLVFSFSGHLSSWLDGEDPCQRGKNI